jgi:hypothetical protein
VVLDHLLTESAGERRGDRGDEDEPSDLLVGRFDRPAADGAEPGRDEPENVRPEVDDDCDERPEVEGDVEGLVEVLVLLEVVPVEEPRHENQVAGRGDREQLGEALHDAEDERLPVREFPGLFTHSGERQDEGESEQRGRHSVDENAASHRRDGT